jgi:hypothetical protein
LPWLRSAAIGAIAFGLCLVTIAWFLTAIMWIVFGCIAAAVIFAAVWIFTHKKIRTAIAADIEGWMPKPTTPSMIATLPTVSIMDVASLIGTPGGKP